MHLFNQTIWSISKFIAFSQIVNEKQILRKEPNFLFENTIIVPTYSKVSHICQSFAKLSKPHW